MTTLELQEQAEFLTGNVVEDAVARGLGPDPVRLQVTGSAGQAHADTGTADVTRASVDCCSS